MTTQLDHLKAKIAEKESAIQKLLDLIEADSTLSSTALLGRLKAREKEKAELVSQKQQLEVTGNTPVKVESVSDAVLDDYIAHVRHVLSGQDVQLGRQILSHLVARIDVITQDRQGTLFYTFPVADLSPVRTPAPEGSHPFRRLKTDFHGLAIPGHGLQATVNSRAVLIGNRKLMADRQISVDRLVARADALSGAGRTVIYIAVDNQAAGIIVIAYQVRAGAKKAISALQKLGIEVAMLTGDNKATAQRIADELGIQTVFAEVQSGQKND